MARHLRLLVCGIFCSLLLYGAPAAAQSIPGYVFSGPLLPQILQMPGNSWLKVNTNFYSDVWTPPELEPLDAWGSTHTPEKIILAWSGFAWDSNRGDLIIYGGGHANYTGNDVYRWHSSSLKWERASLPSDIFHDPVEGYRAIDGVDAAPPSAHTFNNNTFLSVADRFLAWGGATYDGEGFYRKASETDPTQFRTTGPYLFNPNLADGNKVGGTTGSNVKRVDPTPIAGGQMWENRDIPLHLAGQSLPEDHTEGCSVAVVEAGHDVVYDGARHLYGTDLSVWRYQLTDISNPALDQSAFVGTWTVGPVGITTCGYDPTRKLFVRTGNNAVPFAFWDLTKAGPANSDQLVQVDATIAGLQSWLTSQGLNLENCALKFDPVRQTFPLWCGTATIWELHAPVGGNTPSGWTITQQPPPPAPAPLGNNIGTGILGKWQYAPFYDVFVGLEDIHEGHVWIYKPSGWVQPNVTGNALPSVAITSPADGSTVSPGVPLSLSANAGDSDGTIDRVEYWANGIKLGQSSVAPYNVPWTPLLVGTYKVIAIAVDNVGGMTMSAAVNLTVSAPLTTVILQRGLTGYAGVSDTFLNAQAGTASYGAYTPLYLDGANYTPLVRFAVFQSEGGVVPNGAVIQSAQLALYKGYYDYTLQLNPLLKPWGESQATWFNSQTGTPWSAAGAAGAGTDYDATIDVQVAGSFNPGWMGFDVTSRMRQWSNGAGVNYGWRLSETNPSVGNNIVFNSSEYAADTTLRPKLTIVYAPPPANTPPTVTLTGPADGSSTTLGGSFTLTATAGDADGTVAKVEFLANGAVVGQSTGAPYVMTWTPAAVGSYVLTARATDNLGAVTVSANSATVTVMSSTTTTVVLQRGLSGYAGASDTFLNSQASTASYGAFDPLYLNGANYTPLVRFAVFQSEGGPMPDGVAIKSAQLELYKGYYINTLRLNALLKPWIEAQASWYLSQTGVPWSVGGAAGAGTDYDTGTDALVSVGFNPGWVAFDVTPRVQKWSNKTAANYGWRLTETIPNNINNIVFNSSEYAADTTLRPKLTIVYAPPPANTPPTVTLTGPADGSSTTLGGSFTLTATAGDADGTVAKVEFLANGAVVGQSTGAPYVMTWTPAAVGSYVLTARATDNLGAVTVSANSATVTVMSSTTTTVVLQRGLSGYAGASDTFLNSQASTASYGAFDPLYLNGANYTPLVRFAVFQSEGGPMPDGVAIKSAQLELYKGYYINTLRLNALLKPWIEAQASWYLSQTGVPWSVGGAAGAGTDYDTGTDALVSVGFNPGWVAFDVTPRVQKWSNKTAANYGWRLTETIPNNINNIVFNSSEYAADTTLRPKLTVTY